MYQWLTGGGGGGGPKRKSGDIDVDGGAKRAKLGSEEAISSAGGGAEASARAVEEGVVAHLFRKPPRKGARAEACEEIELIARRGVAGGAHLETLSPRQVLVQSTANHAELARRLGQ